MLFTELVEHRGSQVSDLEVDGSDTFQSFYKVLFCIFCTGEKMGFLRHVSFKDVLYISVHSFLLDLLDSARANPWLADPEEFPRDSQDGFL